MILEALLQVVVDHIFIYLEQRRVPEKILSKFNLDSTQQAFKRALRKAFKQFEDKYPEWSESLFDLGFFETEGFPIIAQFLLPDGYPNPSKLATLWAKFLNLSSERHTVLIRETEPAAAEFLDDLARALKSEPDLKEINDSRLLEQIAQDMRAMRHQMDADEATDGTFRDYLQWVINRNLYLDLRGIPQTQRQVQVKLDEVYLVLGARQQDATDLVDRRLLEKELEEIDAQIAQSFLTAEEKEEIREDIIKRLRASNKSPASAIDKVLDFSEIVALHNHLVILGDPGSGKSTLLRYLALQHAQAL
jgi:hypothetical protein